MAGFIVKCACDDNGAINGLKTVETNYFDITTDDCQKIQLSEQSYLLIDGYFWGNTLDDLINIVTTQDFSRLNGFEGHFCGVFIDAKKIYLFNDRFGAKTLFVQRNQNTLIVASRPSIMPVNQKTLDLNAVHEMFLFRWTSADKTLLAETQKLRARSYATFTDDGILEQQSYWSLPTANYDQKPFSEKQKQVKQALINNLLKAQKVHKKVAVFLSGGVDSSLLAALSKEIFDECYLITPVFKGQKNPELATAKAFAQQLNLPHHLVEISPETLEKDLEQLIHLKREPLRHYSSLAMLAMLKAIPDDFDAVIYGEAADTLFGSNGINRINTQFRWKQSTKYVPTALLNLFKSIVPGRGKVLVDLKSTSLAELIYSLTAIQYTPKSKEIINQLDLGKECQLEKKPWQENLVDNLKRNLREVAQKYIISSDVEKHFEEAEMIASQYNKQIISPFFDPEVVDIAVTLNDQQYFGDEYVKPILREIACEYFDRELIYQRKYGFPVPFVAWLSDPLAHLVDEIRNERDLFNGSLLDQLTISDDYEIFWLLINWKMFCRQIMLIGEQH